MEYKSGNKYWFYEFYNNTGRILAGKLVWRNEHGNVKIKADNGNYWYFSGKRLFESKERLCELKDKKLKREKRDELTK